MVGVLMSGLKYYHQVTGDPRVADSIVKAAHFVIDDMWVPDKHGFRYTSCPNTSPSPGLNSLTIEGIAYASIQRFLIFTQTDNDAAWSSSIWIGPAGVDTPAASLGK